MKPMVVENGRVVREYPWTHNLITNAAVTGLNSGTPASLTLATVYAAAGFGGDAEEDDIPGTVEQSGLVVERSSGVFTSGDIGKLLVWNGRAQESQCHIVALGNPMDAPVVDPKYATVSESKTEAAGAARLLRTDYTGLVAERNPSVPNTVATPQRSNTYLVDGNGTTHTSGTGTWVLRRSYDFSIQSASQIYREVGFFDSPTAGILFSRVRLDGDVTVFAGQQLRVVYEITVTVSPVTPVPFSFTLAGVG